MSTMTTKLTQAALEQIEEYLKERYPGMTGGRTRKDTSSGTLIIERIVRVEEELKNQRELMLQMFSQLDKRLDLMEKTTEKRFEDVNRRFDDVNKRFDDVNKRFDDVNRRFTMMMWAMGIGFSLTIAFFSGALALFR